MAQAFKVLFGNLDIMAVLISWAVFLAILFTAIDVYQKTKL
ncbi:hypothetical protein BN990_04493 [Virgibacillus salexigens]|uniref:Uncharacterized protein n=1 Tax=Virgibacillus massiliensis TaxID=1462526 RepID=A0A024QHT9_9BACI|nr:hypothetical protein BN990_04493 [Virgibacillus massiliensis]